MNETNLNHYEVRKLKSKENLFEFISKGIKNISKVVEFQETNIQGVYNLAMGDRINRKISHTNVSNNKDIEKVMETVGYIYNYIL